MRKEYLAICMPRRLRRDRSEGRPFLESNRRSRRRKARQPQTLERGASRSPTDVGHDDQFKNRDIGEFNLIFLDLTYRIRRAKIPLLPDNFSKRASAIQRPSQDELLGSLSLGLLED